MSEGRRRKLYVGREHPDGGLLKTARAADASRLRHTGRPVPEDNMSKEQRVLADKASPYSFSKSREPFTTKPKPIDPNTLLCLGISLLVGSILFFCVGIYAVLLSSHMPDTDIWMLDVIKRDEHYKYLVPLLIPSGLVFVIVNWGGLHYFRHT